MFSRSPLKKRLKAFQKVVKAYLLNEGDIDSTEVDDCLLRETYLDCLYKYSLTELNEEWYKGGIVYKTGTKDIEGFIERGESENDPQLYFADRMAVEAILEKYGLESDYKLVEALHGAVGSNLRKVYCSYGNVGRTTLGVPSITKARGVLFTESLSSMLNPAVSINRYRLATRGSIWVSNTAKPEEIKSELKAYGVGDDRCVAVGEHQASMPFYRQIKTQPWLLSSVFYSLVDSELAHKRITEDVAYIAHGFACCFSDLGNGLRDEELEAALKFKHFYPTFESRLDDKFKERLYEFLGVVNTYHGTIDEQINVSVESKWGLISQLFLNCWQRVSGYLSSHGMDIVDTLVNQKKHVIMHSEDPLVCAMFAMAVKGIELGDNEVNSDAVKDARQNCPFFVEQMEIYVEGLTAWPATTHRMLLLQPNLFFGRGSKTLIGSEELSSIVANTDTIISHSVHSGSDLFRYLNELGRVDDYRFRLVTHPYP